MTNLVFKSLGLALLALPLMNLVAFWSNSCRPNGDFTGLLLRPPLADQSMDCGNQFLFVWQSLLLVSALLSVWAGFKTFFPRRVDRNGLANERKLYLCCLALLLVHLYFFHSTDTNAPDRLGNVPLVFFLASVTLAPINPLLFTLSLSPGEIGREMDKRNRTP